MAALRAETIRLLSDVARQDPAFVDEVLPWLGFLPTDALEEMATELADAAATAGPHGDMPVLSQLLTVECPAGVGPLS